MSSETSQLSCMWSICFHQGVWDDAKFCSHGLIVSESCSLLYVADGVITLGSVSPHRTQTKTKKQSRNEILRISILTSQKVIFFFFPQSQCSYTPDQGSPVVLHKYIMRPCPEGSKFLPRWEGWLTALQFWNQKHDFSLGASLVAGTSSPSWKVINSSTGCTKKAFLNR